ncbi:JmjC domain-containing protein [Streptomyces sp. NPDC059389]|uniref:JmjC domain-containing protein n=1 Tax=Streptomyces sp. NPDC059389 TaxID=3346818 RepID=UPI0036BC6B93
MEPVRDDPHGPAPPGRRSAREAWGPPLAEAVLQAGDMLDVPRGWWHAVAATRGRSVHLTCGLTPATGHHLLVWMTGQQLLHSPTLRANMPR